MVQNLPPPSQARACSCCCFTAFEIRWILGASDPAVSTPGHWSVERSALLVQLAIGTTGTVAYQTKKAWSGLLRENRKFLAFTATISWVSGRRAPLKPMQGILALSWSSKTGVLPGRCVTSQTAQKTEVHPTSVPGTTTKHTVYPTVLCMACGA